MKKKLTKKAIASIHSEIHSLRDSISTVNFWYSHLSDSERLALKNNWEKRIAELKLQLAE